MSFSIFNNPFTTFSSGYSSSYSSVDSTYSASSTGSSPHSPTQRHGDAGEADAAMYPLLKPVTASRPVTGTVSTLLDTQPRPTIISHRHTSPPESASNNAPITSASLSLTKFLYGKLGRAKVPPSITSSGASTPRHGRSRSAPDVLDETRSVTRSRDSSTTRLQREQQRLQRIRDTARILKEELEREGFYVPEDGFNEVNLAAGDSLYKYPRDTPRTTSEIILDDENGPYAADRAAGRRSSVMVPNEMTGKSRTLTQRPPTTHEQPEEHLPQLTRPAEPAQPKHLPVPVPGPVPSAPVSHPPTPPLSGDESEIIKPVPKVEDGTASILPYFPTPPSNAPLDQITTPFPPIEVFQGLGPAIPVELPAEAFKGTDVTLPALIDSASDKGKQKQIETENAEVQIIEAIPDEKEIDALVDKVPVTGPLEEWEVVDKDAGAEALAAAAAAAAAAAVDEVSKGKQVVMPEAEEKEVHILPVDVPAVDETVDLAKEDITPVVQPVVTIADPVKVPLEPRRLEEEEAPTPAVITVPSASEAVIVDEIAKAVDTPVSLVSPVTAPVVDDIPKVLSPVSPATPEPKEVATQTEEPVEVAPQIEKPVEAPPQTKEPVEVTPKVEEPVEIAPLPKEPVEVTPKVEEPVEVTPKVEEPVEVAPPVIEQPKTELNVPEPVKQEDVKPKEESAEVVAPAVEAVVEQPKTEVVPEPLKETETKVETVAPKSVTPEVEAIPSVPEPVEPPKTAVVEEEKKAAEKEEEEPAPVPQVIPTNPVEEIPAIVPAQEPEVKTEPEPKPTTLPEEVVAPVAEKPDVPQVEDETTVVESETQPPMTPPIEKDIQDDFKPIVGDVSPRIPTPQTVQSLDWARLVDEICMDRDEETGLATGDQIVTEHPIVDNVVQIPGPSEQTVTILPVHGVQEFVQPIPTLPQDVIDDLTPSRHTEIKHTVVPVVPIPLPPRRIEDEEKPHVPDITLNAPVATEKAPIKPDLTEFGSQQPAEEPLQVEPEDVTSPAREEPVTVPGEIHPIDTIKLVHPEVIPAPVPAPPPVRNIDDERADDVPKPEKGKGVAVDTDSDEQWVPKFKEPVASETTAPVEQETPALERVETHTQSVKEKSGFRRLGRTLSFGSKKQPHMGDIRPATSHSAAISIGSVDDDKKSMAESTRRPNFLSRSSTKRILTMGLAGKDKEKKDKDNASVVNSEGVISSSGKAASIRSVSGAISPGSESAPSSPVKRTPKDMMKLAIGMKKKPQEAGAESTPASPIDGPATATSPAATPTATPNKRLSINNAVNLMMKKKKAQDEKVRSAEAHAAAAAAAAAAAVSPPPTPGAPATSPPATPAAAVTSPASESTPSEAPAEATPPPTRRRKSLTMNNAVNLMMLRKKVKEDMAEAEKTAPSAPATPGGDSAVAVEDDKSATTPAAEQPAPTQTPRRRNTLTLKEATNMIAFRKKAKDEKEEHEKANGSSDAAIDDSAVDATSTSEVSPPSTPMKRRNTMTMNNAVNLMMLRKGKGKDKEDSASDADTPKKDKRMSMSGVFGRKKSSSDSPTVGGSASRPITSGSLSGNHEDMKSNNSFTPLQLETQHPGLGLAIDAESSKQPSKAPSVYSVDQRPGTSASSRGFGGLFKKRTPSVYSKDHDSHNPFNSPTSPFPSANGNERPPLNHTESSPVILPSEGEEGESGNGKPKFNRRWSVMGGKGKSSKLGGIEVPKSSSSTNPPATAATTTVERPGTSASITNKTPASPSKIPVPVSTGGTVPTTTSNPPSVKEEKSSSRPKLAGRARTLMTFGSKKSK